MRILLLGLITTLSMSVSAHDDATAPALWSWFKDINKSKEACEIQSSFILNDLNLENQKQTEYGIYGNVKNNKVVVKCISISENQSKLMVAVAGHDSDSVEMIRNKIIKSIK